jgi:small subunit ribosomal protein S36
VTADTRRWHRSVHPVAWLLVALNLGLLTSYAVLVPTWRAPDEPQHADMVFAVRDGGGWPDRGERRMTAQIIRSYEHARFDFEGRRDEPRLEAPAATPRAERPTFAEIAPDEQVGSRNGQFQHPPLYALTVASALTVVLSLVPGAAGWSFDAVVVLMRLVGALLVAPLPLLAYLTARRLGTREAVALAAAAVPLGVPTLTHIGAAVNPDALVIPAVGLATLALTHVAMGDLRRRTAVLAGLATGLAVLGKGLALFLPAMLLAAYALAGRSGGWPRGAHAAAGSTTRWRRAAAAAALALAVSFVAGGWWWLRNLVRYGSVQPTGAAIPPAPEGFEPSLGEWLRTAVTVLPPRWWGSFGWYQAELPGVVAWGATALVGALVVAALVAGLGRALRLRPERVADVDVPLAPGRPHLLVLLAPLVGTLGIVAYGAYGYYVASSLTPGLQGRYLLGGVTGLAVVVAVGAARLSRGSERALPLIALLAAGLLQLVGLATVVTRWYGIPGVRDARATVAAVLAWSPWPKAALVALVVALLAVASATAALLLRRRPDEPRDAAPRTPRPAAARTPGR